MSVDTVRPPKPDSSLGESISEMIFEYLNLFVREIEDVQLRCKLETALINSKADYAAYKAGLLK